MFCTRCGFELEEQDLYCAKCGSATRPGYPPAGTAPAILSRPAEQKKVAGVCAGFARYFGADLALMRILWVALTIMTGGLGLLVYVGAWILMPKDVPAPVRDRYPGAQPV
jgi:phage shock protein C